MFTCAVIVAGLLAGVLCVQLPRAKRQDNRPIYLFDNAALVPQYFQGGFWGGAPTTFNLGWSGMDNGKPYGTNIGGQFGQMVGGQVGAQLPYQVVKIPGNAPADLVADRGAVNSRTAVPTAPPVPAKQELESYRHHVAGLPSHDVVTGPTRNLTTAEQFLARARGPNPKSDMFTSSTETSVPTAAPTPLPAFQNPFMRLRKM